MSQGHDAGLALGQAGIALLNFGYIALTVFMTGAAGVIGWIMGHDRGMIRGDKEAKGQILRQQAREALERRDRQRRLDALEHARYEQQRDEGIHLETPRSGRPPPPPTNGGKPDRRHPPHPH